MRHTTLPIALVCVAALAGCGGDKDAGGGPTILQSVGATFSGNDHSCPQPALSGSPEQVTCHEAAKASCSIGTSPDQVDFIEEGGEFLVRGYSCV